MKPFETRPVQEIGALCEGSGQPWWAGTDAPICRACRRGPNSLGVQRPVRRKGRFTGKVPDHVNERTWRTESES